MSINTFEPLRANLQHIFYIGLSNFGDNDGRLVTGGKAKPWGDEFPVSTVNLRSKPSS